MSRRIHGGRVFASLAIALFAAALLPTVAGAQRRASGLHDVVVYDPGVNDRGLPAVQLSDKGGGLKVEMPPSVHVHRYYYSGDKEIQGPIISGGPTVVVARHPKTAKQMYIDVVLPAGAPEIVYRRRSITYYFKQHRQRVELKFGHNPNHVNVKRYNSKGSWRTLKEAHAHAKKSVGTTMRKSKLIQSVRDTADESGKAFAGVTSMATELAGGALEKVNSLIKMLPGANYLQSTADDAAGRSREAEIRAANRIRRANETEFVPTNR